MWYMPRHEIHSSNLTATCPPVKHSHLFAHCETICPRGPKALPSYCDVVCLANTLLHWCNYDIPYIGPMSSCTFTRKKTVDYTVQSVLICAHGKLILTSNVYIGVVRVNTGCDIPMKLLTSVHTYTGQIHLDHTGYFAKQMYLDSPVSIEPTFK